MGLLETIDKLAKAAERVEEGARAARKLPGQVREFVKTTKEVGQKVGEALGPLGEVLRENAEALGPLRMYVPGAARANVQSQHIHVQDSPYPPDVMEAAAVLSIGFPFTLEQLQQAYRATLKRRHPDAGGTASGEDVVRIQHARGVLSGWHDRHYAARG